MTATEAPVTPPVQDGKSPVKEKKKPEEVQEEATTFLTTGKRNLLVKDIPAAVSEFAQACELLSAAFGETGKECAESYYYYGKALLEMSRLESGVLGNALDGVPEEEDEANSSKVEDPAKMTEEEKKDVVEKVGEALKENLIELEKKVEEKETQENDAEAGEDEGMEEGAESQDDEESKEPMETEDVGEEKSVEKDDEKTDKKDVPEVVDEEKSVTKDEEKADDKKDEEEEPSNLQLAWEMLELAKVIYTKVLETVDEKNKKETEEKLCRTILLLGEVSIENENYSQAVEDIEMCLKKQEAFSKDSRLVAETNYQLGVAQGFNSQYDDAVGSLNSAIQIIRERVKKIKELGNSSEDKKEIGELEASIYKKEIEELEALIPEIEEKIKDTKDMKQEAEAKPKEDEKSKVEVKATGDVKSVSTIAVKRKAEDDDSQNKKSNDVKTAAAV